MRLVDARVEQRDDDAASRRARERRGRARTPARQPGRPGVTSVAVGIRDANRIDGDDLAIALEQLERRRVEPCRDRVQHADVAVLRGDRRAARGDPAQELLLRRTCRGTSSRASAPRSPHRPPLARAWRATARAGRRCSAARSTRPRERRARPASPPRRWTRSGPARRPAASPPRTAARTTAAAAASADALRDRGIGVEPEVVGGRKTLARSAPPTRSSRRCPCRARAARSARQGARRGAPSSPRRRRRRRSARGPSARRPRASGPRAPSRSRPGTRPRDRPSGARPRPLRGRAACRGARS